MRRTNEATRGRCHDRRAYVSTCRDIDSIAEFERVTHLAGLLVGLAFGLCIFFGLVL